jgi:hypothetical protein
MKIRYKSPELNPYTNGWDAVVALFQLAVFSAALGLLVLIWFW